MRHIIFRPLAFLLILLMGCHSGANKKIALVNLMQHPVLDSVESQTKAYLLSHGYDEAHGYSLIEKNLNGQKELLPTVANEILNENPSLVIAITTPVAQTFVSKAKCPVVFGLVTDPVQAGILDSLDETKPTITGSSDIFPYAQQLKLIRQIHPSAKTIGMVYDPGEAAAQFAVRQLGKLCPQYGFELLLKPATSSTEVPLAATSLLGKADVLLVSSDNTVIESVPALVSLCVKNALPLYVGETGSVEKGAIATCSVSYGSFGQATGKLAVRMLSGERNIPIYVPEDYEIAINTKAAELMHVKIPDSILAKAKTVYTQLKGQ